MFLYSKLTLLSCVILQVNALGPDKYPDNWIHTGWDQEKMYYLYIKMTEEIIKDVEIKMRQADHMKEEHSMHMGFNLGNVAAGLMSRYRKMLKIYKTWSKLRDHAQKKHFIPYMVSAYGSMRGIYHEMILERNLFYEMKLKHEATTPTTRLTLPPRYPTMSRPRMRAQQKWAPSFSI